MSSTDDRIVRMQFDNAQFKKGAAETQKSLADLEKATDAAGKSKGLMNIGSQMQQVGVQASKMAIVTTTALATIANKVTNVGINLAKSLTLDPIKQGFSEYESLLTKQNTIQNATGKSAKVVKGVLNDLNAYSDKTIYSFGNMTDAITKFVNAGVPLKTSVTTIKGIANAAAFAGASSDEASRAMYAFSQSMSLGFVGLQDWMQIENANMGTIQFKKELLNAAVAAGTLTKKGNMFVTSSGKMVSATKGWRDGLQEQWATTEVLNTALGKYADTNTKLGKKAFASAQEVRTFTAFMDTLKESIGSGWSQIFTSLFGNLDQATSMWTGLSNAVGGAVQGIFGWLSTSLKTWRAMGGFEKTVEGFKNLLSPIGAIFTTIGKAMNAAFPNSGKGAGQGLYAMSAGFAALTTPLRGVAWLIEQLVGPLTLFFRIVKIGGAVIRQMIDWVIQLGDGLKNMFGGIGKIDDGGFLDWLKQLAGWLTSPIKQISDLISKGKSLGDAFKNIKMPKFPKLKLPGLPGMPNLGGAADGASSAAAGGASKAQTMLKTTGALLSKIGKGIKTFVTDVGKAGQELGGGFFGKVGALLDRIGEGIRFIFEKVNWEDVLASFNLAIFATFALSMSRMFNAITQGVTAVTDFKKAGIGVMEDAGSALKSFQTAARAKLILNIAIAIGILAVSLWILSKIPLGKTAQALVAMGAIFLMLNATMKSFTGLLKSLDGKKVGATALGVALAIGILAGAMFVMAAALILFNYVDWSSIAKGMVTMFAMVKAMSVLGKLAAESAKNMIAGAAGIYVMAAAILVMAFALIAFKLVDWEAIGKAGVVLAGLTLAMVALSRVPWPTLLAAGAAMLAISVGMVFLATALVMLAVVKWESIGKLAVILLALTVAITLMMATGGMGAAVVILAMAGALIGIAMAGMILNKVNWSTIGKIALILTILTVALAAVGVVSYFVGPALLLLGAAMFLLGAGLLFFTTALSAALVIAAAGTAGFAAFATAAAVAIAAFLTSLALQAPIMKDSFLKILQALIDTIVEAVPMVIRGIKDLWKAVIKELGGGSQGGGDKAAQVGKAGKSWMDKLGDALKKYLPVIIQKGQDLLVGFLKGMAERAEGIGGAAAKFVAKFIQGVANNIGGVIQSGANLIIAWIRGIGKQTARIADAAIETVITFINAMADSVQKHTPELIAAFFNMGTAVIQGLGDGLKSLASKPKEWISEIVGKLPWWAKKLLHINSPSKVFYDIGQFLVHGLTNGIADNAAMAINAVGNMVSGQIAIASAYVSRYVQDLDQQAIKARGIADGLAAAAEKAAKAAEKTKSKKDDKAAANLQAQADAAARRADSLEAQADKAAEAADRKAEFKKASLIEKAQMRSEDAQNQLDAAKEAEQRAIAERAQADALVRQSKAAGVTEAQRKEFLRQAAALRDRAAKDAKLANTLIAQARSSAADALKYQKLAGDEAAKAFQDAFEADAKAAADEAAFDKMSNSEKAALRRQQAADLQAKADADLAEAKKLAYTDLEAANDLAAQALQEADDARQLLDEANDLSKQSTNPGGGVLGTVIDLQPTEDAARQMQAFEDAYNVGIEGVGNGSKIEFNQYNTSPEALPPSEIYRNTNSQITFAQDKLDELVGAA